MGFWQHITSYFNRGASATSKSREGAAPRTGGPPLWMSDGRQTAMNVATVYCCIRLLCDSVASLPLFCHRLKGGIFVPEADTRLAYLLNVQPDYSTNAFDFWRRVVQDILTRGNAYIVPVYNPVSMGLDRLVLCGPGAVQHDTINDKYTVSDASNGIHGVFSEEEIIHIKGLTLNDRKRGVSVLTYARYATEIATTSDRETQKRFATGGTVRGLVSNDKTVQGFGDYADTELERTAERLNHRYNVLGENIVASPGQVGFTQISLSSVDMQFLESRKFTVREICRFFRVPPSFVYDDGSTNYKSTEQADIDFLNHTLNPLLRSIEAELHRKLVSPAIWYKRKFLFDRRGLYTCDLNSRIKYQAQTIAAGLYTVNEWRREENKPPVEGGDTVLVSANLRNITESGNPQPAAKAGKEKDNDVEEVEDDEKE